MKSIRTFIIIAIAILAAAGQAQTTQFAPPNWALDRIDQRTGPLSGSYSYTTTGAGVNVYVVDSGIRLDHTDFAGRITVDGDFVYAQDGGRDCTGHGTAVAGIAAGTTYGVAKGAQIHVLRVLGCSSEPEAEMSRIVQALDWIRLHHVKPAVVNLSLNYDRANPTLADALSNAVANVLNAGVIVVSSAGNAAGPYTENWWRISNPGLSCDTYYDCPVSDKLVRTPGNVPAAVPGVIVVGATRYYQQQSSWDQRLKGTHWLADVYAPGSDLKTASIESSTASQFFYFTSAATPVVTGVVARYLQSHPTATPAQVRTWVKTNATMQTITRIDPWEAGLIYMSPTE